MTEQKSTGEFMGRQEIICALEEEGFSMLKAEEPKPEDIILSTIMQNEPRLLLGIPLLVSRQPSLNFEVLYKTSKSNRILPQLGYILEISALLTKKYNPQNTIYKKIFSFLGQIPKPRKPITFNTGYSDIAPKLKKPDDPLMLKWNIYFATKFPEFEDYFRMYGEMWKEKRRYAKIRAVLQSQTNDAIRLLFTDTQIEIINKKIFHEKLTKTEREYFSRTIKKRLNAIQHIARDGYLLEAV